MTLQRILLAALFLCSSTVLQAQLSPARAAVSFGGKLPPPPVIDLTTAEEKQVQERLLALTQRFEPYRKHTCAADVEIFLKALRYALEFHEWYDKKPGMAMQKAQDLLAEAEHRTDALAKNETPWLQGHGWKVLGYYSHIDGSAQPYAVEIPEGLQYGSEHKAIPMWIWLHGRGDSATDLHYIHGKLTAKKPGQFPPDQHIVVHPFGRYCNGWKSAGETDVLEVKAEATRRFNVDPQRIVLAGFSMGGAGAWHMGAHYADQWACVHTGAGFVDVKRYNNLTDQTLPPWYEQKLWGIYDVPAAAANFKNVPLISYSGELDKQRASADYMTEVLAQEGITRPHLIGPGMGHKYKPEMLPALQGMVQKHVQAGKPAWPKQVTIQTSTLAYAKMHWLTITGIEQLWTEARATAKWDEATRQIRVQTKNVSNFSLHLPAPKVTVLINGKAEEGHQHTTESGCYWTWHQDTGHVKRPGLQGPMDDAFRQRFIVVLPDNKSSHAAVDEWVQVESAYFIQRWRSLMRGDVILRKPAELQETDTDSASLILWGTPESNSLMAKMLTTKTVRQVLTWNTDKVQIGEQSFPAAQHVPLLCLPNPLNPRHYVVFNTGLTFREAHDRTNSLQNPKLPDWAILDITQKPTAETAGKVVATDFFDSSWKVLPRVKAPTDRD
jgi:predicted esterase